MSGHLQTGIEHLEDIRRTLVTTLDEIGNTLAGTPASIATAFEGMVPDVDGPLSDLAEYTSRSPSQVHEMFAGVLTELDAELDGLRDLLWGD